MPLIIKILHVKPPSNRHRHFRRTRDAFDFCRERQEKSSAGARRRRRFWTKGHRPRLHEPPTKPQRRSHREIPVCRAEGLGLAKEKPRCGARFLLFLPAKRVCLSVVKCSLTAGRRRTARRRPCRRWARSGRRRCRLCRRRTS